MGIRYDDVDGCSCTCSSEQAVVDGCRYIGVHVYGCMCVAVTLVRRLWMGVHV